MIRLTDLLNESSPGFENRKTGDKLPTLDSVRDAYQAKKAITENDDDKYTHIGYGKYKPKGKEKDSDAPIFTKDDNGKYNLAKGDAKGGDSPPGEKDKPKVNIFDKPKKDEPKKAKFKDFKRDIESTMKDMGFSSADLGGMEGTEDFEDSDGNYMQIAKGKLFDDPNKFAVFGGKVDDMTDARADNHYKSFNSKEDAVAYAKELGQKLKGGKEEEPKGDEPKKDSANSRPGNPEVNKVVRKKAQSLGITPQKLGKEEYESRMSKAAIEALTDANFHPEARKLIAVLEDKPEWANDPRKDKNMPDIMSPEYEKWRDSSVYSSTFYDSAEGTDDLAHAATGESGWDGVAALDAIAYDLKMNGSKKLAAKLQGIIDDTNESSTNLKDLIDRR